MRFRLLLLHALLSLALVANGVGAAVASVHAVCAHSAVAAAASAAESPCHEGMGAGASKAHRDMQLAAMQHRGMQHDNNARRSADPGNLSQHGSGSDKKPCSDCGNHCQCACIVHGLAALVPAALLLPAGAGIAYTPAPSYAHASPALPHPVRPPIG